MSDKGTLQLLAEHLARAVEPLRGAVTDLDSFRTFMLRLGWEVESLPPAFSGLADVVERATAALDALGDDPEPAEVRALLSTVRDFHAAIARLADAPAGVDAGAFLSELGERLFELLLVEYLAAEIPVVSNALEALGVIQLEDHEATGSRPAFVRTRIRFDEIPRVVADPASLPERVYGWGSEDFDFSLLAQHAIELFLALGLPASMDRVARDRAAGYQGPPEEIARPVEWMVKIAVLEAVVDDTPVEAALALLELPAEGVMLPGVVVEPWVPPQIGGEYAIDDRLTLRLRAGSDVASTFGVVLRPGELTVRYPFQPGAALPSAGFGVTLAYAAEAPRLLLGHPGGTRLELTGVTTGLQIDALAGRVELRFELTLEGLALVLAASEQDGFLGRLFGSADRTIAIPLTLQWSSRTGVSFSGSAGFEVTLNPHLALGPITVQELRLGVRGTRRAGQAPRLVTEAGVSLSGALGPVAVSVEGVGIHLTAIFENGNAGPFEIEVGFKPPSGVGLVVDGGPITGGGFLSFDHANGRYAGVLQLEVYGVEVAAVGLLETRLPGGTPGFAFLIIISTEFTPIQLGFGFTLNGVGGLAGIHRTVAVEALQAGIRGETLDHVLFPEDPVRDAPQLISDLRAVFPAAEEHYVFGPMALIGWGTPTLLEAELGIILKLPDPVLILLGQLSAHFPTKDAAVVELHIEVLGVLDFPQKRLAIDARLHDSRVALFTISGAMAFRLSWGEPPSFALALGGLHPHFQPPPGFPGLERLTVALGLDENPRISLQAYLALTSNSLQFGAKAELYAAAGDFNIYGWIEFDALVTLAPLYFRVDFSAGVALRWDDETIAGIHLDATLEGPAPWHAWGEASISLLFFDVSVPFDARVGEARREALPPTDPWPLLEAAIEDARNWSATLPPAALRVVTLAAPAGATPAVLVDPVGGATLRERVVPLNRPITRFGAATPTGPGRYDLRAVAVGDRAAAWTIVRDYFAPAQFSELTEAEKLSGPSFEKMDAGMTVANDAVALGSVIGAPIEYETAIIDSPWDSRRVPDLYTPGLAHQLSALGRGAAARSLLRGAGLRRFAPDAGVRPRVRLADEGYVVASTVDLTARPDIVKPGTLGEAAQALADYLAGHPEEAEGLQVIPESELARAA